MEAIKLKCAIFYLKINVFLSKWMPKKAKDRYESM